MALVAPPPALRLALPDYVGVLERYQRSCEVLVVRTVGIVNNIPTSAKTAELIAVRAELLQMLKDIEDVLGTASSACVSSNERLADLERKVAQLAQKNEHLQRRLDAFLNASDATASSKRPLFFTHLREAWALLRSDPS